MKKDKMVTPKKTKKAPKNTRILFILDRSGSMSNIIDDTIGGFNSFVEGQKAIPGNATLSLIQFDHEYEMVYNNIKLDEVPLMTRETFKPRGMTALYDAVGFTMAQFMDKNPKDTKTIVTILTDGQENKSVEFTHEQVQDLIKIAESEHGWEVLFVGANIDAKSVAHSMGIKASNSVTFDYNAKGVTDVMSSICSASSAMRGMNMVYADGSTTDSNGIDMSKIYASTTIGAMNIIMTSSKP